MVEIRVKIKGTLIVEFKFNIQCAEQKTIRMRISKSKQIHRLDVSVPLGTSILWSIGVFSAVRI